MILCFSATGNSQYVADKIAEATGDQVVSLNRLIKHNQTAEIISENHPLVFVCPVYAWRIPRIVEEFIRKTAFRGRNQVYVVMTCGSETANAVHYVKKLCHVKGWELRGFGQVIMPENYIAMFPTPEKEVAKAIIQKADAVIAQIAADISQEKVFYTYEPKGLVGKLQSGAVNSMFYGLFVRAKGFHATDRCNGCGQCAVQCPLNNISLVENRPVWKDDCTHCMACISRCPTEAIEYKNKTQNKPRYSLEATL